MYSNTTENFVIDKIDMTVREEIGGEGVWVKFSVRNNYCKCIFYVSFMEMLCT